MDKAESGVMQGHRKTKRAMAGQMRAVEMKFMAGPMGGAMGQWRAKQGRVERGQSRAGAV